MAAYKIGNFTFDTEEEYARGLEDAKKIEKIQSTVDLNEPETALRLYWLYFVVVPVTAAVNSP